MRLAILLSCIALVGCASGKEKRGTTAPLVDGTALTGSLDAASLVATSLGGRIDKADKISRQIQAKAEGLLK
jgi:hypothetical protein